MIANAEGISANSMSSNLISPKLPSIRKASINKLLSPTSSIMIRSMTSWKDPTLTSALLMATDSEEVKEMMSKDLALKISLTAMDHALNWVHTEPNSQVTKVTINTWSQQTNILEATSLFEANPHTANNSTTKNQKKMTINTFQINWRQVTTGLEKHPMEISIVTLTLSTWQRKSKSSKRKKTTLTFLDNMVFFHKYRNYIQERFHSKRNSSLPCKDNFIIKSSR